MTNHPDHLRALPADHDDPDSPTYVAPNLRDLYVQVVLTAQALDQALRHRKAREDHQEDLRAFERQRAEKQQRHPDLYPAWLRERTKPANADQPNGPRVPSRYGLSMLDDRPQDTTRGTMSSGRVLTPEQIDDETHQLILTTARQHAEAAKAAPALEAARVRRETCTVCGVRAGLDVRPERLVPAAREALACRDCTQVVPLLAALTAPVGQATTRLELAAAWLDQHHADPLARADVADLDALVDDWLDSNGPNPLPTLASAAASAAHPGGVLARLRGRQTAPADEPSSTHAETPDSSASDAIPSVAPGRRRLFGGTQRPKG